MDLEDSSSLDSCTREAIYGPCARSNSGNSSMWSYSSGDNDTAPITRHVLLARRDRARRRAGVDVSCHADANADAYPSSWVGLGPVGFRTAKSVVCQPPRDDFDNAAQGTRDDTLDGTRDDRCADVDNATEGTRDDTLVGTRDDRCDVRILLDELSNMTPVCIARSCVVAGPTSFITPKVSSIGIPGCPSRIPPAHHDGGARLYQRDEREAGGASL